MRNPPTEDDSDDLARLNAAPWQIALLDSNPDYTCWGPHEDYMIKDGENWDSPKLFPNWKEFGPWGLDDLNELVNFYFSVRRKERNCETCGGSGYHPDAQWISESFYGHSTPFREPNFAERRASAVMARFGGGGFATVASGYPSAKTLEKYGAAFRSFCEEMRDTDGTWNQRITDDEVDALWEDGRLKYDYKVKPSASQVNANQRGMMGHDAINRSILIRRRCERLGVPKQCASCDGHGSEFIAPAAHVSLTLWFLHPRKGCSRGVEVEEIEQAEMPEVFAYLRGAAERNARRFSKLPTR